MAFGKFNIKNITTTISEKAKQEATNFIKKKSQQGCKSCGGNKNK